MKSFKEEINEDIESFTKPVSQMFKNIGYSISDTISDAVADRQEQAGKYDAPQKKGCLWPIIKWILILSVVSAALSECSGGDSSSVGNGAQSSVQATEGIQITETQSLPGSIDNIYELIIATTKNNIDTILATEQPDMGELQSEYEFLLFFKINEYMYKASAYGYFTGDYENNQFADIMTECEAILQEMKMHFSEDEVDDYFTGCSIIAYQSYDENNIDYDAYLIGSKKNPNVDAMWLNYVEALAENAEWNIQNEINAHGMDMYSMLIPAEFSEMSQNEAGAPTQNIGTEENYIVGYVMYDIGGGLNVRTGPGVEFEKVGRLPEGEHVIILETHYSGTAEWGRIEQGWVCMDYVQIDVAE